MFLSKNKIPIAVILFILTVFCWYFFSLLNNIPRDDEYWLLADFNNFYSEKSFWEQLTTLFKVKNSHRFVPVFALYAILLKAFGTINLQYVVFLGFILLLGFIYLLSKPLKDKNQLFVVPLFLVFLNPLCYSMTFFAEHVIQYLTLFLSMIACIYLITYKLKERFWFLILLATVCSYTFGNGLLVWIIGAILIASKLEWKLLKIWTSIAILNYIIFFVSFQNSGIEGNAFDFLGYLDKFAIFILSFPGSGIDFFPQLIISNYQEYPFILKCFLALRLLLIVGLPLITLFLIFRYFLNIKKTVVFTNSKEDSFLLFTLGILLFVVFSGGLAAIFRSHIGYGEGIATRYRFFGQLFIAAFYFLYIFYQKFSNKSLIYSLLISSIYWTLSFLVFLPKAMDSHVEFSASELNALDHGKTYIFEGYTQGIVESIDHQLLPSILESKTFSFTNQKLDLNSQFKTAKELELSYQIHDNTIILELHSNPMFDWMTKKFLLVKEEDTLTYIPLTSVTFFSKLYKDAGKLKCTIYPSILEKNNVSFFILTQRLGENKLEKLKGFSLK